MSYVDIDDIASFIENEIAFHKEVKLPWYLRMIDDITGRRYPNEIVVRELELIQQYLSELKHVAESEVKT